MTNDSDRLPMPCSDDTLDLAIDEFWYDGDGKSNFREDVSAILTDPRSQDVLTEALSDDGDGVNTFLNAKLGSQDAASVAYEILTEDMSHYRTPIQKLAQAFNTTRMESLAAIDNPSSRFHAHHSIMRIREGIMRSLPERDRETFTKITERSTHFV